MIDRGTMHKRFPIIVLAVALLLSQGGNFLVASLCPHLRSALTTCEMPVTQPAVSHQHTDHTQMESNETELRSGKNAGVSSFAPPEDPCKHCAVHSRPAPDASSFREFENAKRSGNLTLPFIVSRALSVPTPLAATLSATAHGPPGEPRPRHILISIFRI